MILQALFKSLSNPTGPTSNYTCYRIDGYCSTLYIAISSANPMWILSNIKKL